LTHRVSNVVTRPAVNRELLKETDAQERAHLPHDRRYRERRGLVEQIAERVNIDIDPRNNRNPHAKTERRGGTHVVPGHTGTDTVDIVEVVATVLEPSHDDAGLLSPHIQVEAPMRDDVDDSERQRGLISIIDEPDLHAFHLTSGHVD